jgi:two-component system CheB/CheR fusion protein
MRDCRIPSRQLRAQAEDRLRTSGPPRAAAAADEQRVLHELEVARTELEIQNEELRSARTEGEAALASYTELFEFAPIGYAKLSADGVIRELNHAGARLLGRPRSRAVGTLFVRFVARADHDAFCALLRRVADSSGPRSCELTLAFEDRTVPVRLSATEITAREHAVLLAFEDMTERLQREQQLARTEQALRDANRRKDEFLAMLSHELRNPLGPISGSLFILDHVDPSSPQAREARAIIDRQVSHLTRLLEDLLDVTRIARGKIELQCESVELGELLRRAIEDHRTGFETRGIRLETRFGEEPLWLTADPARLVQIASNLLGNAEKFTPAGGIVTVSLEPRDQLVALRVRDTGVGIAPELIPGLFEPFAQAPQSLDRTSGGLGLGLATVKGMAELHGGSVQISSDGPGCGTEVVVLLPRAGAPAEVKVTAAIDEPAQSRRILVIEDNFDVGAALGEALRLMGHDVRVTDRGAAGLELARTFQPEAVICDLGLPDIDGYAVAAAFRADPQLREIQLIALSGYARAEDRRRAAEAGFDHHVAKPPDLAKLGRLLASGARADASSPPPHPESTGAVRAAASS